MKYLGQKGAILFGLVFEIIQLACYGFGSQTWYVVIVISLFILN